MDIDRCLDEKLWPEVCQKFPSSLTTAHGYQLAKEVARAVYACATEEAQRSTESVERLRRFVTDPRLHYLLERTLWKNAKHLTTPSQTEEAAALTMKLIDMILCDPDYQNSVMGVETYTGQLHCYRAGRLAKVRDIEYSRSLDLQKELDRAKREEIAEDWSEMRFVPHDSPELIDFTRKR